MFFSLCIVAYLLCPDVELLLRLAFLCHGQSEDLIFFVSCHSDYNLNAQGLGRPSLLEVGAASLLVADTNSRKGLPWKHFGTADMPYLDQLLQPTSMSSGNNCASARHHLRIITASKRTKSGSQQIWQVLCVAYVCII